MEIAILIPAFEPDSHLLRLLEELKQIDQPIIIVDDGTKNQGIFERIEQKYPEIVLLHHQENMGKGAALKTGFKYVIDNFSQAKGIATMDADGQHLVSDLKNCLTAFENNPSKMVLGVRTFSKDVPLRSRFGNELTKALVKLTTGISFSDTQTGLRVIPISYAMWSLGIADNDYAFEFAMLLDAKERELEICEVPINTVYEPGNLTSHFHVIRDSLRIYLRFLKFLFSGLSAFVVDTLAFAFIVFCLKNVPNAPFFAACIARLVSGIYNYLINRHLVFDNRGKNTVYKYIILAVGQGLISAGLTTVLTDLTHKSGMVGWMTLLKVCVDCVLFFISYQIQKRWVFYGQQQ